VHYQFTLTPAQLKVPGIWSTPGVVFGALAAFAEQTHWPLVGNAVANNRVVVPWGSGDDGRRRWLRRG
jgi:hypothetical protein